MKHTPTLISRKARILCQYFALGTLCAAGAFALGLQTAGEVQPFESSQAAVAVDATAYAEPVRGDLDGDGVLTVEDAILMIQFAEEIETASSAQIRLGDTDGDYRLTYRDALQVLRMLSSR